MLGKVRRSLHQILEENARFPLLHILVLRDSVFLAGRSLDPSPLFLSRLTVIRREDECRIPS